MRKTIQVLTSDPERPQYPLQVAALVGGAPATLGVEPADGVDFQRFAVDAPQKLTVTLTNYSPDPMRVSIIGQPLEFLDATLSREVIQPRESVELTIATRDKPPLGRFNDAVTLLLDEARNTRLTVPIQGVSMMR